jgi:dCMP deaminase
MKQKDQANKIHVLLNMATELSSLGTCSRLKTACIFTDSTYHILAAGYNGSPPGMPHCTDNGCIVENNHCVRSLHGEKNALLLVDKNLINGGMAFITHSPCARCFNDMIAIGIKNVYYLNDYGTGEMNNIVRYLSDESGVNIVRYSGD